MQRRLISTVCNAAMIGVLAIGLAGCTGEPEEPDWIDAEQARDGSIATLELIRDLVPEDAIDTTQLLPELAEHHAEPQICEGVDAGSGGAAMYYPGETLVPLTPETDPAVLIDDLVNELHVEHGWRITTNLVVTADKEGTDQGLVTDDDYMVALRTVEQEGPQLEISAWSACYTDDTGEGLSGGNS